MADEKNDIGAIEDGHRRSGSTFVAEKGGTLPVANKHAQMALANSHEADEAMKAFESGEMVEIDEATNKRLLRTIDLHMLPL